MCPSSLSPPLNSNVKVAGWYVCLETRGTPARVLAGPFLSCVSAEREAVARKAARREARAP
jgi:hypothetical protein